MSLRTRLHERDGVALILALVFVVLLAVIVTEFTYEMQVDAVLISQESTETEAILAGRSAIALSMSVLAADLIIGEEEASAQQTGVYDSLDEPWASGTPVVSLRVDPDGVIKQKGLGFVSGTGEQAVCDIRKLLNSPEAFDAISIRARRYVEEVHTGSAVTRAFNKAILPVS